MTTNQEEIKNLVREKYGTRARGVIELKVVQQPTEGDSGCCGPADLDRALRIYSEGQVVAMDRPLDRLRDDLGRCVTLRPVPDQRRDQQGHVHHQPVHRAASLPWFAV